MNEETVDQLSAARRMLDRIAEAAEQSALEALQEEVDELRNLVIRLAAQVTDLRSNGPSPYDRSPLPKTMYKTMNATNTAEQKVAQAQTVLTASEQFLKFYDNLIEGGKINKRGSA